MSLQAAERFVEDMAGIFRCPQGIDPTRARAEYISALQNYGMGVLPKAWPRVRDGHGYANWPTLKAIHDVCRKIERENRPRDHESSSGFSTKEMVEFADKRKLELIDAYEKRHSDGYRLAQQEGWNLNLEAAVRSAAHTIAQREFIRDHGQTPSRSIEDVEFVSIDTDGHEFIDISQGDLRNFRSAAQSRQPFAGRKQEEKAAA